MKHFHIIPILWSLFAVSYLPARTIETGRQPTLTINVTNKTAGGASTANDEVFLSIFEQGKTTQTLNGSVDSEGKVVFENVPTGRNITAIPIVKHLNMTFNGHPVALEPGKTVFSGHVDVFDVSTDKSKLSVTAHHFIIKPEADYLRITEYMQLYNSSDMAITSDEKDNNDKSKVIEVLLPKGFKDLVCSKYFQQDALVVTKDGFFDTMATPPGKYDAEFSYTLEIDSDTIDIIKEISLPTSDFTLFSLLDKGRVKGLDAPAGEIKLADGRLAEYFSFQALKSPELIKFRLDGFNVKKSNNTILIASIAAFVVIALLVIRRLLAQKSS